MRYIFTNKIYNINKNNSTIKKDSHKIKQRITKIIKIITNFDDCSKYKNRKRESSSYFA